MDNIKNNINKIISDICKAEIKSGRSEGSVKLLAVSKFHPVDSIIEAIESGQKYFGENRVQEAYSKFVEIKKMYDDIELHIIGQLQSNKVKKAVEIASYIESVDRIELVKEIEKQAAKINKRINILFELHTAEDSKSGYDSIDSLLETVEYCSSGNTPHITVKGLMTMAPFTQDENIIRKSFISLRNTANLLKNKFPSLDFSELSMGMSGDFEIAIEEGSTQVRVGTAIFGERVY
ncbi:MAG: YggS family pyridoxal phosphate-dependent enzyme [Treponema sp.]|nr:YggS family pyridoxal phosphate-dependent enzyme [Treponema sp.]